MTRTPQFAGETGGNPENRAFWDSCRQGRLMLRRCSACGRTHWYPRPICPHCGGDTDWFEASGRGAVYAFSVMERAAEPYAIAYVTLAEGPRMLTGIVGCDFGAIAIGMAVRVVFTPTANGPAVPMFTPA